MRRFRRDSGIQYYASGLFGSVDKEGPRRELDSANRMLWWWFVGTRGGPTRARIVLALRYEPLNAKQLADLLGMNYKTVRHHLKVLSDHNLLVSFGDKYGKAYSLSPLLELNYKAFVEVQKAGLSHGMVGIIG